MLVDTHCHLNDPSFSASLPEVIGRAEKAGVERFIVPAYDEPSLERTARLATAFPSVIYSAFGIHPWYLDKPIDVKRLLAFVQTSGAVAVGEIGLDFSPGKKPIDLQIEAFSLQLEFAREVGLPVIVHCRKAHDELYRIMKPRAKGLKGVLHSFSGNLEMMRKFLDLGLYVSFSGSVTRKTAKKYHKNAAAITADRFLLETDAPSIATESTVASQVEPRHVVEVANKVAELRNMPFEIICKESTENGRRLFNLY